MYNPSRRSNAPLPALSRPSYSSKTRALYAAEYVRDRAFAGTSGSTQECVVKCSAPCRLFGAVASVDVPGGDLGAAGEAEFGQDVLYVAFYGALGEHEALGDLPVAEPFGE